MHECAESGNLHESIRFVPGSLPGLFDVYFVEDQQNKNLAALLCHDVGLIPLFEASPLLRERYSLDPAIVTVSHVEVVQRLTGDRVLPDSLRAAACASASRLAWASLIEQVGVASEAKVAARIPLADRLGPQALSLLRAALLAIALGAQAIGERCLEQVALQYPDSILLSSATDVGAALALLPASAQSSLAQMLANSPTGKLVIQQQALRLGLFASLEELDDQNGDDYQRGPCLLKGTNGSGAPDSLSNGPQRSLQRSRRLQEMRLQRVHTPLVTSRAKENIEWLEVRRCSPTHGDLSRELRTNEEQDAKLSDKMKQDMEGEQFKCTADPMDDAHSPDYNCAVSKLRIFEDLSNSESHRDRAQAISAAPAWEMRHLWKENRPEVSLMEVKKHVKEQRCESAASRDAFSQEEGALSPTLRQNDSTLSYACRVSGSLRGAGRQKQIANRSSSDVSTCSPQTVSFDTSEATMSLPNSVKRPFDSPVVVTPEPLPQAACQRRANFAGVGDVWTSPLETCNALRQFLQSLEDEEITPQKVVAQEELACSSQLVQGASPEYGEAPTRPGESIEVLEKSREEEFAIETSEVDSNSLAMQPEQTAQDPSPSTKLREPGFIARSKKHHTSNAALSPPEQQAPLKIQLNFSLSGTEVPTSGDMKDQSGLKTQRRRSSSALSPAAAVAMLKAKRRAAEHQRKISMERELQDEIRHMVRFQRRDERLTKFKLQKAGCISPRPSDDKERSNSIKSEEDSEEGNLEPELTFRPQPPLPHPEPCQ